MTDGFPYRVYAGNAGRLTHLSKMRDEGIGNLVTATDWSNPKDGIPWVLDNGAYAAYQNDEPFPEEAFLRALLKAEGAVKPPQWVVVPDKVAAGTTSLQFSEAWIDRIRNRPGWTPPLMLAVQDGMKPWHILDRDLLPHLHGIFIGGSRKWKRSTGGDWRAFCDQQDLHLHIGRVGRFRDLLWAARIGADSVDSSSWTRNDSFEIIDQARSAIQSQTLITEVTK